MSQPLPNSQTIEKLEAVLSLVRAEALRAMRKHPPMATPHHGYAVIQEEVDELWDLVKSDDGRELSALEEATQIAAVAVRYIVDMQAEEK